MKIEIQRTVVRQRSTGMFVANPGAVLDIEDEDFVASLLKSGHAVLVGVFESSGQDNEPVAKKAPEAPAAPKAVIAEPVKNKGGRPRKAPVQAAPVDGDEAPAA
jgi:hypothetical protein